MNFYEMGPEEQRNASAARLFRYLRDYIYPYHPYLRRLYQRERVDLSKLRTPDDVRRLPIIDKSHLQSDPQLFILRPTVPGGPRLPEGYETEPLRKSALMKYTLETLINRPRDYTRLAWRPTFRQQVRRRGLLEWQPIHYIFSTGSSGTPTPVTYTHHDFTHVLAEMTSLFARPRKLDPNRAYFEWTDRIMNVFPGAPHMAFFGPVLAKVITGVSSFETFGGAVIPTEKQIMIFAAGGFTTLAAVPSYLVRWLRRAAVLLQEGKIRPLARFKSVLVGAEPLSAAQHDYIRGLALSVGADPRFAIHQTLGMTEMKWTSIECADGSGLHLNPKYFFCELLHPETREPVAPGEPGVLVFSHIGWRGTALVRFWTGDLIKGGARWDRCGSCGLMFPRIYPPICRAERDFTKLKGARVDLSLLVDTVRETPGVRQFQIILENENPQDRFSRDVLTVHLAAENGSNAVNIEGSLRERLKTHTEVSPDRVIFEDDEESLEKRLFARNGIKAEYLVERRAHHI
ncbi:MAG TPA: AMP-binding protein [Bryobacteraceae bacterium]|nr:AMP-binding protein [Bryobacteraceae bacterium]